MAYAEYTKVPISQSLDDIRRTVAKYGGEQFLHAAIFEDEFLANIVLPSGALVASEVRPRLAAAYEGREMPALLPDYTAQP